MSIKRKILLVDPKFQIKFCIFVCTFVGVGSIIYPLSIYDLFNTFIEYTQNAEVINRLQSQKSNLILLLILFQFVYLTLIFIICIFQSHRIVGPIYKLKTYLLQIKEGNPPRTLFFRKGDNFQDVAIDFNMAMETLKEQHQQDFSTTEEIALKLEELSKTVTDSNKQVLNDLVKKLKTIHKRYQP